MSTLGHTPGHINCPVCDANLEDLRFGGRISTTQTFAEASERWLDLLSLKGNI